MDAGRSGRGLLDMRCLMACTADRSRRHISIRIFHNIEALCSIRLVHIYPTIWWGEGTPSDGGRGFRLVRFSFRGADRYILALTQTLTQTPK